MKPAEDVIELEKVILKGKAYAQVFSILFAGIAHLDGEYWELRQEESARLGETFALGIQKSFPDSKLYEEIFDKYAPWLAFGAAAFSIVKPRLKYSRSLAAQAETAGNDAGMHQGRQVTHGPWAGHETDQDFNSDGTGGRADRVAG